MTSASIRCRGNIFNQLLSIICKGIQIVPQIHTSNSFSVVSDIQFCENVFTEPSSSNEGTLPSFRLATVRGTHIEIHRLWGEIYEVCAEMRSTAFMT